MARIPCLLQQFARLPVAGTVKTRLQPFLSAEEACAVHEELMLNTVKSLLASGLAPVELWLDRVAEHRTVEAMIRLGAVGPYEQAVGDLGQRMHGAMEAGLGRARSVVLVGSDCPGLDGAYLDDAFRALDAHDVVLGPAEDGGYVLIGARRLTPDMFQGVPWGGDDVLATTQDGLDRDGLTCALLATRYDVDRPEDYQRWRGS